MTDAPGSTPSTSTDGAGSSTPSTPVENTGYSGETSTPVDGFSGMDRESFDDDVVEVPSEDGTEKPASVPAAAEGETAPPAKPAEAPKAPVTSVLPTEQTKPEAVKPPAPKEQQGDEPPSPSSSEPASLVQQLSEHRGEIIDTLASQRFALSKEEMDALEVDAVAAIPKIMARTYYEAITATLNHIHNMVPKMIVQHQNLTKLHEKAETAFYGKFPALSSEAHGQDVGRFAQMFRSANPSISQEELIALTGAAVMAKYGLASSSGNGAAAPKTTPQQPFKPAQPGSTVRVTQEPADAWAGMDVDFEE